MVIYLHADFEESIINAFDVLGDSGNVPVLITCIRCIVLLHVRAVDLDGDLQPRNVFVNHVVISGPVIASSLAQPIAPGLMTDVKWRSECLCATLKCVRDRCQNQKTGWNLSGKEMVVSSVLTDES